MYVYNEILLKYSLCGWVFSLVVRMLVRTDKCLNLTFASGS